MQEEAASTVQALEEEEEIFEQWIANAVNAGELDFTGSYGVYYREIFLHIPFLIANHLNSQQKFAEAQKWYHYIFNPTASEVIDKDDPACSPKTATGATSSSADWPGQPARAPDRAGGDRDLQGRDLQPPRHRPPAPEAGPISSAVVMKYIDNLLDWGDHLFAQDTMESINEATMLYVLAADILGERPARWATAGSCRRRNSPMRYRTAVWQRLRRVPGGDGAFRPGQAHRRPIQGRSWASICRIKQGWLC